VRRQRLRRASQILEDVVAPDVSAPTWKRYSVEDVWQALDELPESIRVPYQMHVFENADYAAISMRLGIPKGTVGTRLLRARHELRAHLLGDTAA